MKEFKASEIDKIKIRDARDHDREMHQGREIPRQESKSSAITWDEEKENRRKQIAFLLTVAGINPGQPEVFRLDKTKDWINENAAVARLDALLAVRDEDFVEDYSDIIKQADAWN